MSRVETLIALARRSSGALGALRFGAPVAVVYDPLTYAWAPHEAWLRRYGEGAGRTLLVGMNPGPFGMSQTGVPFGDPVLVRGWLGLDGVIERPGVEHPRRPILGWASTRREVSGSRLWAWAAARHGTAEAFFERFFVVNWCPLAFLESNGRNLTPDHLGRDERVAVEAICDELLAASIAVLAPRRVVGIGAFAEARARRVAPATLEVGRIPHPSPASPLANRGWASQVDDALAALGVER